MIELIEQVVKELVDYPEAVSVSETMNKGVITYHLSVHEDDMGRVIGKHGSIIKSIRTIVYAAATIRNERVHLEIS